MNLFFAGLRKTLKPRPKLSGSEWADRYRIVAAGTSPEPGQWRTSRVPYMREPLDMATAASVEKVVIMAASQVAKSELLINVLGYYVDQEPSSIMMVQPTVEAAEAFSKERVDPTLQSSPALKSKMSVPVKEETGRSRKSGSTIRMKNFVGGHLAMVGSNSPAGLASRPIRVLLCDEIDRFGSTQEGDPLKLAVQRTQNFSNRKVVFVSTPTTELRENGPTIFSEFMKSDQREFMVKCPHCGERFAMAWQHVKWQYNVSGELLEESIHMECPHCEQKVRGNGKPDPYLLESGIWEAKNPSSQIKGYHLTSLCSPWVELKDLVSEWVEINHNKDHSGMQEFINLKLGEPWHEEQQDLDLWEKLSDRREWYGLNSLPAGILLVTCGVDVQRDRLEASVYGYGEGWETWGICHRILLGDPLQSQVWSDLDAFLMRIFKTTDGRELRISCTFIDSGDGATTERVYQYVKGREVGRVFAIKGQGGEGVPLVNRPTTTNRYKVHLFSLGVDGGKVNLIHQLKNRDVGPGFWHYSHDEECGHDTEFFKQLTCEVKVTRYQGSKVKSEWIKHQERNEAEDCAVYAMAAAEALLPDFAKLKMQIQLATGNQDKHQKVKRRSRVLNKGVEL